jgi:hypothetical protein
VHTRHRRTDAVRRQGEAEQGVEEGAEEGHAESVLRGSGLVLQLPCREGWVSTAHDPERRPGPGTLSPVATNAVHRHPVEFAKRVQIHLFPLPR